MTHVSPYAMVDAPNYGDRVPVDTAPGPVPVYRALRNPNSPSEHCNCTTVAVDCTQNHQTNVVAHNGRVNDLVQAQVRQAATVGARLSPPRLLSRNVDHLISVLQLKKLHEDQGNLHLRHDWDVNDLGEQRFSQRAGTVGERLSHPQPARENL